MGTAIVVSHSADAHATSVVAKCIKLGYDAVLWDISLYPKGSSVTIKTSSGTTQSKTIINIGDRRFAGDDVSGVFWRRPQGAVPEKNPRGMSEYVRQESEVVRRSLIDLLPTRTNWMSHPEKARLACRKPVQLDVARSIGMRIPTTCITNSRAEILDFLCRMKGKQITIKPVGTAFMLIAESGMVNDSENLVVFTKVTRPEDILANIHLVENCPVIFQEVIHKDSDIRVTVIDDQAFAAEITTEGPNDPSNLDWRNYSLKRCYARHELPMVLQTNCIQVVRQLGLRMGCIDLAYSKNDGYTFFEVNPQGQWLPSEQKLGYDISGAIAQGLTRCATE